MASEDSDQISSGLLTIHRFSDLRNVRQAEMAFVDTSVDHLDTASELLEISLLRRMHVVLRKERNDRVDQIRSTPHHIAIQVLLVIVVSPIGDHASHSEEAHELVQTGNALHALRYSKLVRHLIAGLVAFPARSIWLPNETNGEATLSVYKTNNPAELNQPFLLVFCTHHVVTVPPTSDGTRSVGYSGFPAYGRMRTTRLPAWGATIYLRTVPELLLLTSHLARRAARSFLAGSHGRP